MRIRVYVISIYEFSFDKCKFKRTENIDHKLKKAELGTLIIRVNSSSFCQCQKNYA